ncbi:MAG: hypothetical protein LBE18_01480 [Planctomycetaceae bacterium]|jgi:tetratricopeptide (TPR) repeat protein|nr:hypothetical protein [Planctomycetaceae bacterium]
MTIKTYNFLLQKNIWISITISLFLFSNSIIQTNSTTKSFADEINVNNNDNNNINNDKNSDVKNSDEKNSDMKNSVEEVDKNNTSKSQIQSTPKNKSIFTEIRELIHKLGDDSFVVRERASKRLLQIGSIAESELRRAINNNDAEISRRAEFILSQLDQIPQETNNENIEIFIKLYSTELDPFLRLSCIWQLGNPLPDSCKDGEGLQSLCRIIRSDKNEIMRNEATKCIIALAPLSKSTNEKWYQNMKRIFLHAGNDPIFKLIRDYASLRIDLNNLRKKIETELENQAIKSGESVEYPVTIPKTKELETRIKNFAADLDKFQSDPLYSNIRPGHWIDILVFYSIAELYDELGMNQERDNILKKTLTIREQKIQNRPIITLTEFEDKEMNEHFFAGNILYYKQRLKWAEQHLKLVIENGHVSLKIAACSEASMIRYFMADLQGTIEYLKKYSEIAQSDNFTSLVNNANQRIKENESKLLAYQAQLEAEKNNWEKTKELVDNTLEKEPHEIDTIILRYKICERDNIDPAYKNRMRTIIEKATLHIRQEAEQPTPDAETKMSQYIVACNKAAWLLANTNGEFTIAKDLINITIKHEPESSAYLDTQASVFALGKQFDKAIEIQTKAIKLSPEAKLYKNALEQFKKLKNESNKK